MKKILLSILLALALSTPTIAAHIKGGFFTYQYLGPGSGNNVRYRITLTVYMICGASTGQISTPIPISIFSAGSLHLVDKISTPLTNQFTLSKGSDEPCISGDQRKCYYTVAVYDLPEVELPISPAGYIVAYQRCCRIAGINNIIASGSVGNTFSIQIPGTATSDDAVTNSSPIFQVNDTAVVCSGSFFTYSFEATDNDAGDSLAYEFCNALIGGGQDNNTGINGVQPDPASNPPYSSVPYSSPYSGGSPMGAGVTINAVTGLISGVAPIAEGDYVVAVCVKEYKDGVLMGTTRKELHVEVGDCSPLQARLDPKPTTCDGFTVQFANDAVNFGSGIEYKWTFGEPSSGLLDTSFDATPSHTYALAGDYLVKLKVSAGGGLCADSAKFTVKVYPGFFPGFKFAGGCFSNPYQFTDTTKTNHGTVSSWKWNFGDATTTTDISNLQNPSWNYVASGPGPKSVKLVVGNSKGCIDSVETVIDVLDKPALTLQFKDTLICTPDAVQLLASGQGVLKWTPNVAINDPNIPNPTVNPTTNTWYVAALTDAGCVTKDSVHVRVVHFVSLVAMKDTTICLTDAVQLDGVTDALQFTWSPAATLDDPLKLRAIATPVDAITRYVVEGRIGSCTKTDDVIVTTVPYPVSNAGPPQSICYNTATLLNGTHDGSSFIWSPAVYLNNASILNPTATPPRTTEFILSSWDTKGCPKPGRDTVLITVMPRIRAFAGRDTTVVVGQPLQFQGTGGVGYQWRPGLFLDNPNIADPIGIYPADIDSIRYQLLVSDEIGCTDSAYINVTVFKTKPYVFVPSAFTPNSDGLNDLIRPIAVGVQRINSFSIYNRWGQLVFTTTINGHGWDGRIKGELQANGVFVWMVSAIDYLGKPIFLKGTVTLIR